MLSAWNVHSLGEHGGTGGRSGKDGTDGIREAPGSKSG